MYERDGWVTPLNEVKICPEAASFEVAGLHTLAQRAQAAASNLADRFYSAGKEPWTSYFTREVELDAYRGSAPPAKVVELIETVKRQGAARVYFRVAKNGEALVLAIVPTLDGDKRVRLAQWAPEGLCTKLSEIKHANRVAMSFVWVLLVLSMIANGFVASSFITGSDDANWYLLAAVVLLYSTAFSIPIRRKLISRARQVRLSMP
jgi:hypothetical protein